MRASFALLGLALLCLSELGGVHSADIAERRPPSERNTPYAGITEVPDVAASNSPVLLDEWAGYHDYFYLSGTEKGWVVGPVDQCFCRGWTVR
jgi:hypothetical protein